MAGTEVEHLLGAPERQRATFRWKADDLDADGLRVCVGASTLTLGGLLKHLAANEDHMFFVRMSGEPMPSAWDGHGWAEDDQWELTSAAADSPETLYAIWEDSVRRCRDRLAASIAEAGLDQTVHTTGPNGEPVSLRRLVVDLIEEYARHTGHADLIREAIDGRVGEDPPPDWRPGGAR